MRGGADPEMAQARLHSRPGYRYCPGLRHDRRHRLRGPPRLRRDRHRDQPGGPAVRRGRARPDPHLAARAGGHRGWRRGRACGRADPEGFFPRGRRAQCPAAEGAIALSPLTRWGRGMQCGTFVRAMSRRADLLVETEWLAEHLRDPGVRVLECTVYLHPEDVPGGYRVETGRARWS